MAQGKKSSSAERRYKMICDPSARKKTFELLLKHVRAGFSMDCFPQLSDKSIEKCLKEYPEEFIEEDLIEAMREAKTFWEGLGRDQANGKCLGNSRSWFYNMANRYGWRDKVDVESKQSGEVKFNVVNYATPTTST